MRASATTLASEVPEHELSALLEFIRAHPSARPHLEIGTAAGGTLKELMRCYPDGARPRFVVVDPMRYFEGQLEIVHKNLASAGLNPDEVDFRISKSWPAFLQAEQRGERFAFIFVDGSHKISHVTEDLAWTRLLEPGGVIAFHDYSERFPGVTLSVDRFLRRYRNYRVVRRVDSLLIVEKTVASTRSEISWWDRQRARLINVVHQLRAGAKKRMREARA